LLGRSICPAPFNNPWIAVLLGIRILLDIGSLYIRNVSILVGVLWYLVASHLRLLGLSLRGGHGVLVLPLG
jgi:hypothetical protein